MSGWRTSMVVGQCFTCGWRGDDFDHPRRAAGQSVAHKRKHPDHHVVIDREQSRAVCLSTEHPND